MAIVGGSLGGLAAANVFHRLGANVTVFEKSSSTLDNRGGSLGFLDVDLWQRVRGAQLLRKGKQASYSDGLFYYGQHKPNSPPLHTITEPLQPPADCCACRRGDSAALLMVAASTQPGGNLLSLFLAGFRL